MKYRILLGAFAIAALVVTSGLADDALKSGPQIGEGRKITPFNPLHCNGPAEGKKVCLV